MSPSSGAIYEIPTSDPLVAPAPGSTPATPDQIHVTLGGDHVATLTCFVCLGGSAATRPTVCTLNPFHLRHA